MNLVTIKDGDAVTTTLTIAMGTLNDHASVIALVRKYVSDLEEFGLVRFQIRPRAEGQHGGGGTEFALLTEPQATLLLTFMRNTDIVRAFKKKLVREFWELVQQRNQAKAALPDNYIEALEHLLASKRSEQLALEQRDEAVRTKALIGAKREATAMATASAAVREAARLRDELGFSARHATILKVEAATNRRFSYVNLRRWCKEHGVTPETVPDKRYAEGVKAWPAAAWAAVFDIDLAELFGAAGEQA